MNDYINSKSNINYEFLKSRKTVLVSIANQRGNYLSCVNDDIYWGKSMFKWKLIPVQNNKWFISYTTGFGAFSYNYYLYACRINSISYSFKVTIPGDKIINFPKDNYLQNFSLCINQQMKNCFEIHSNDSLFLSSKENKGSRESITSNEFFKIETCKEDKCCGLLNCCELDF
jgi:hypothetical protein